MEQAAPRTLGAIQDRLRRLITDPEGVAAALAAAGDADGAQLAALLRGGRGPSPADRVSVYANAYFARLHDCLREDFAALARALGRAAFHDLVKTYLMVYPPTRPSLRHAGAHLAEHLAKQPFAEIFSRRCPYAVDLARLEQAIGEAFEAPDAPILAREDLAALAPERWSSLRFETAPSLRLLACRWPVQRVRERFDAEGGEGGWEEAPALAAEPTWLRVFRRDERVLHRAISELEFEALGRARAGAPFGALCERLASAVGDTEAAPRAAAFLASWVSDGLLARSL
jgi:hypothetical protein